jgi:N-dimethylarginine dimethylaminohydrolase
LAIYQRNSTKKKRKKRYFPCSSFKNDKSSINEFGMVCQPISVRYFAAAHKQRFVHLSTGFLLLTGKSLILAALKLFLKLL